MGTNGDKKRLPRIGRTSARRASRSIELDLVLAHDDEALAFGPASADYRASGIMDCFEAESHRRGK